VSGIEMAAISAMPHMTVTYQKNVDSVPLDLSHSATYSAATKGRVGDRVGESNAERAHVHGKELRFDQTAD